MTAKEPIPIDFADAIGRTANRTRSLLLGNGFSISARSTFGYATLFSRAGTFSPPVTELFNHHKTEDFERILGLLRVRLQDPSATSEARAEWRCQEDEVRTGFINALSAVHPESSMLMRDEECRNCASFLEHFVGRGRPQKFRGRIYTTNYDLLLYWVVARSGRRLSCYDSHISPVNDKRVGLWHPEKPPDLVYLHGALHLYDAEPDQEMLRYYGKLSLIEQTRKRLDAARFPVIVSEGTSEAKLSRIARSEYLSWGSKHLRSGTQNTNGVLFTFGHSLSDRDAHLIQRIGEGRISAVYIGAWGGLEGSQGTVIRKWAEKWWEARSSVTPCYPLEVLVYDTSAFSPWHKARPV